MELRISVANAAEDLFLGALIPPVVGKSGKPGGKGARAAVADPSHAKGVPPVWHDPVNGKPGHYHPAGPDGDKRPGSCHYTPKEGNR